MQNFKYIPLFNSNYLNNTYTYEQSLIEYEDLLYVSGRGMNDTEASILHVSIKLSYFKSATSI